MWARANDLHLLVERIDAVTQEYAAPIDGDIVLIIQRALKASNRTLDELARRCLNLGDRDDLNVWRRMTRPVGFILSSESIQKFEQQLQTNIMSVQIAFFLLGRGEQQEMTRRVNDLFAVLESAVQFIAQHKPFTGHPSEAWNASRPSLAALEDLDGCVEAATSTMTSHNMLTVSSQSLPHGQNEASESPLQQLATRESEAWGEIAGQPSRTVIRTGRISAAISIALIDAIKRHSREDFQGLLDDSIDINYPDDQGYTPLMHTTCQHKQTCDDCVQMMRTLLEHNVDVDVSRKGETALHMSVEHENIEAAKALLQKGANIDASYPDTPLMLAVQSDKPGMVEFLLTSTSTPNVHMNDRDNWGLIHHATWHNSISILRTLLACNNTLNLNMDLNARCTMDWTPLMRLAENAERSKSIALATMLLDHGADVNAVDMCERSALYYAVTEGTYSPRRNEFVRLLVEKGADVDAVREQAPKRVVERFAALRCGGDVKRRDSAHENGNIPPVSRRGSSFRRLLTRS